MKKASIHSIRQELGPLNADNMSEEWNSFAQKLLDIAASTLGLERRNHRDWFKENEDEIKDLLDRKNRAHTASLRNPNSAVLRQNFAHLRSTAQSRLHQLKDEWCRNLAREIQGYADTNNTQKFYEATKKVYGSTQRSIIPVRSADGDTLIGDKAGIMIRWAEHFNALPNINTPSDHTVLDELPRFPPIEALDIPPTMHEVMKAIENLKPRKSPGPDRIPPDLLLGGRPEVHTFLYEIITEIWNSGSIPSSWKDALIIAIYKNKEDKAECGNSPGIFLLS